MYVAAVSNLSSGFLDHSFQFSNKTRQGNEKKIKLQDTSLIQGPRHLLKTQENQEISTQNRESGRTN